MEQQTMGTSLKHTHTYIFFITYKIIKRIKCEKHYFVGMPKKFILDLVFMEEDPTKCGWKVLCVLFHWTSKCDFKRNTNKKWLDVKKNKWKII